MGKLREAGFNAIRIAHQPASEAMLRACDEMGVLLLEESFDTWSRAKKLHDFSQSFHEHWRDVLSAMAAKDHNHPCVFAYCLGNEIEEIGQDDGIHLSRLMSDYMRKLDPTRFVTEAMNGGMLVGENRIGMLIEMGLITPEQLQTLTGKEHPTPEDIAAAVIKAMHSQDINDFMTIFMQGAARLVEHPSVGRAFEEVASHQDICGYNYMRNRYSMDREEHPNRLIFGSETTPPTIDLLWAHTRSDPSILGDFTWTGWDYIGESGIGLTDYTGATVFHGEYPSFLAYCGDLDINGFRRPLSYFREIVFGLRKKPYLSVQDPRCYDLPAKTNAWAVTETVASWTWPGCEGKNARVRVYAGGNRVALFLNGELIGEQEPERFTAEFTVPYASGVLEAISYDGDAELGRDRLETAGGETELRAEVNHGETLTFVELALTDHQGRVHTESKREITVECAPGVKLLGFGSADPMGGDHFTENSCHFYYGRVLAVLRGNGPAIFRCDDCEELTVEV